MIEHEFDLRVCGDEVHLNQELVALLTKATPGVAAEFRDFLENPPQGSQTRAEALDALIEQCRKVARGGFVSLQQLRIIKESLE